MAQSKEFVDCSHALNKLSHTLTLLESKNAYLQCTVHRLVIENARLQDLVSDMWQWMARARYDRSVRDDEMDEMRERAVALGVPDYWLGIEDDE